MTIVSVTPRSLCRLAITSLIAIAFCASTFFGAEAQTRGIGIGLGVAGGLNLLNNLSKGGKASTSRSSKSSREKKSKKTYSAKKKGSGSSRGSDEADAPARGESEPKIDNAAAGKPDAVTAPPASSLPNVGTAAAAGGTAAAVATSPAAGAVTGDVRTISSDSEIKAAQQHLQYMGYDVGDVSGKLDLKTKIATMQFQDSIGEPSTGVMTVKQLQTLFLKVSQKTAASK